MEIKTAQTEPVETLENVEKLKGYLESHLKRIAKIDPPVAILADNLANQIAGNALLEILSGIITANDRGGYSIVVKREDGKFDLVGNYATATDAARAWRKNGGVAK